MKTIIDNIDEKNIDENILIKYANLIKNGETVILPTETVYGLGANALDENAVAKIYEAKGRPSDNPLIVHIDSIEKVNELAQNINYKAKKVMNKFWPGPITIILDKKEIVPNKTSGGLKTVALRMPNNNIFLKLISLSETPIAAPSANISGKPSPTKSKHVVEQMNNRVSGIICGNDCDFGIESTIVDFTEETPVILRPGSITKEELESEIGEVLIDKSLLKKEDNINAKAPGMKYKHYSPNAEVFIVDGNNIFENVNNLIRENKSKNLVTGVICIDENKDKYDCEVINLGSDLDEVGKNLFASLIDMDNKNIDIIYSEYFGNNGVGMAVMNRLLKSAGYKVIKFD